jgi:NADH:ubiquinone oxidoreductase subunit 5 (subunit L)/multisubunit Na+/H+ antiporter MnhA subunit
MVVLVPAIGAPVIAFAGATERQGLPRLLALLAAFLGAMELLVVAADLLTLMIGFELVGACSWALITHEWWDPRRPPAANHAFLATRLGDLGLVVAAGAAFAGAGSMRFEALQELQGPLLHIAAAGVFLAAAAKSAQLPFSPWLFSAMAGPTPVSALLHSATMVAAGAYVIIRLAPALEAVAWFLPALAWLGLGTALVGGVVASLQPHIKRALAASTSAHYGLILVAVAGGSAAAAGLHLVTHAAFKALLFLAAGLGIHAAGSGRLDAMRLGSALPRAAILFGVGVLALAAVPPLGGAYSKEKILSAAMHHSTWLGLGVLMAGALSAFYAFRLHALAFGPGGGTNAERASIRELVGPAALAFLSLLLGLLWLPGGGGLVEEVIGARLIHGPLWELLLSLATIGVAGMLVAAASRRAALFALGVPKGVQARLADWLGLPTATDALITRPVYALARGLASIDDRVVDLGVRAAAAFGRAISRLLSLWAERGVDGVVGTVARLVEGLARGSGEADDRGVDRTVEGLARGIGFGGAQSRRLQTGLAHHYYVILALGIAVVVFLAIGWP